MQSKLKIINEKYKHQPYYQKKKEETKEWNLLDL